MYLGLDLGTSELKALLLDRDHRVVASAGAPLKVDRPRPLWSEQRPDDWWLALESAVSQLAASHGGALREVRAIGLSGQMHGAVLLDAGLRVLRPAMLWNDGRAHAECAELEAAFPALRQVCGNLAMAGFTAPKLLWLRRHEPELFSRIHKVLCPKDYLRLRLTGQLATDCSDASGTLFLDVGGRRWSPAALAACGLGQDHMPALLEGSQAGAAVDPDWARRFGLAPGALVAGGGGDNACSGVGVNAVRPGQGFVSLGTSGVVFAATDRFLPDPDRAMHAFCHALPGRWHQMSVMLSAAASVRWAAQVLGLPGEAALLDTALALPRGRRAKAPLFLPDLSGERTPHNDATLCGSWSGLRAGHEAADLAYAAVEGVSLGLLDGWRTLSARGGAAELAVIGGGSRSAGWVGLLASTLNVPLVVHEDHHHCAALGAARLAWLADGGAVDEACRPLAEQFRMEPQAELSALMEERHAGFTAVAPSRLNRNAP